MELPFKKSKKPALAAQDKPKTKPKVNPLKWLRQAFHNHPKQATVASCVAAVLVVDILLGLWAWQRWVVNETAAKLDKLSHSHSKKLSVNTSNYLDTVQKKLNFFTQNVDLKTALQQKDDLALKNFKRAIQNQLPKNDIIRLIPTGTAELDTQATFPLRYLELELVKQAEKRLPVLVEAVKLPQGWRMHFVLPIPDNKEEPVAGVLMVTLPMSELFEVFGKEVNGLGQISLLQLYDTNRTHLMYSSGNGSLPPALRKDVFGTRWLVEFLPNQTLLEQTQENNSLLLFEAIIAFLATMALALWGGFELGRRREARQLELAAAYQPAKAHNRVQDIHAQLDSLNLNLDDDAALLGLTDAEPSTQSYTDHKSPSNLHKKAPPPEEPSAPEDTSVPAHIFRAYDIRGLANTEITTELAQKIGQALGSEALEKGESHLFVAKDARTHSPLLTEYLVRGILSTGCNVINLGTIPTPLLYFATETLDASRSGVMVTASHNGAEFNGFKVVMQGQARQESDILALRSRILARQFKTGQGEERHHDIAPAYIDAIFNDIALASDIHVVIDAGNGVTGKVAPRLFQTLGCRVSALFCDFDGTFPNHGPDPSIDANLKSLIGKVREEKAHLGVAFDGDGDRLAVVTPVGQIIWADRLLMLLAKDILGRNPGADVVFDVKSTRRLTPLINSQGGRPILWKTGHAPMRAKMQETGALLGGEFSGHIFIKDRWHGFDDGLYAAARLIEIMSLREQSLDALFAEFPPLPSTPDIRVAVPEEEKFSLIEQLIEQGDFGDAKVTTIDGLRADFAYGWGLVRASNTGACITLRFEADSDADLHQLKALFTREIRKINNRIQFNW